MSKILLGDQILTLRDGRKLGYKVQGNPNGKPLFFFHGTPGSRLFLDVFVPRTKRDDVLYVTTDRPGYGNSDHAPKRKILDWVEDIAQLADYLGIGRFYVAGASGGGPYVDACVYAIPERIIAANIICGMGPTKYSIKGMSSGNTQLFWLAKNLPFLLKLVYKGQTKVDLTDPVILEKFLENAEKSLPAADVRSMRDEEIMKFMAEDKREAHKQGSEGTVTDVILFARDWGFQLEDIQYEHIFLWHGEEDVNVPIGLAKNVAKAIPNCKATFYPGEGHISLIYNYHNEMMDTLLAVE